MRRGWSVYALGFLTATQEEPSFGHAEVVAIFRVPALPSLTCSAEPLTTAQVLAQQLRPGDGWVPPCVIASASWLAWCECDLSAGLRRPFASS